MIKCCSKPWHLRPVTTSMRQTLGDDSELAGPSGISIYRQPSNWLVIDSRRKLSSPQIPQGSSPRRSNVIYRNPLCEECAVANTMFPKKSTSEQSRSKNSLYEGEAVQEKSAEKRDVLRALGIPLNSFLSGIPFIFS